MSREKINEPFLNDVVEKMVGRNHVSGAILCVENGNRSLAWVGASGNLQKHTQYFVSSVTKLYITAVLLHLKWKNKLQWDDNIYKFFPEDKIKGLHVFKGVDYTKEITIKHLMSNTSGIPDYFSQKQPDGKYAMSDLLNGKDESWPLERILETVRKIEPKFKPGENKRVYYSDTNYELLGAIIENITGKNLPDVFQESIFDPLNLSKTYTYKDISDKSPSPMYYKAKELHLPLYMASITAQAGIVSTAEETMIFLKAFFDGYFFPKEYIEELKKWNFIFYPSQFYFGIGLEKLWTPRVISPKKPIKEILGFWGQSGAFAFYNPETDLYFTGTINQISGFGHSAAFKAMVKIIKADNSTLI